MVSDSQRDWLGYDGLGAVGTLELGYGLFPMLELRVGAALGGFPSANHTGGLLQPQLGAALIWPESSTRPWLQLDGGLGFTGSVLRPALRASLGVDFQVTSALSLGPVFGYSHIFQHDLPGASTDARFLWFGLAFGLSSSRPSAAAAQPHLIVKERVVTRIQRAPKEPAPEPIAQPAPEPVSEPSPELRALLETALPTQQREWLAPVLFASDSTELEPQGIAMLHEVARELQQRTDIAAVEIHGYADARGSVEYNVQLSERRAQVVRTWLIDHGIASERLRVAAHGKRDLIEPGSEDQDHAQNRRVVFRVVEVVTSP